MVRIKIMKNYKSPDNKIFAYELDGSQNHLIPDDFIAITDEEAKVILEAQAKAEYEKIVATLPNKEDQIAQLQKQINDLKEQP
jgi:hypothetical protein